MGYANPDRMLAEISFKQLNEWVDFFNEEGFDNDKMDSRFAVLYAELANLQRSKPSDKVWQAKEFMPTYWKADDTVSTKEAEMHLDVMEAAIRAMNKNKQLQ